MKELIAFGGKAFWESENESKGDGGKEDEPDERHEFRDLEISLI